MRLATNFLRHERSEPSPPLQTKLVLGSRWQGPTLGEFVDRVEREFGAPSDLTDLLSGAGRNEPLAPAEVRALCGQLGVPAEDFGVEP